MKKIAIILLVLFLMAAGYTVYLYTHCTVSVEKVACIVSGAENQRALFDEICTGVKANAFTGITFTAEIDSEVPEAYQFVTYYIRLNNTCYLTADMLETIVTPQEGDVVQLGDTATRTLPAQTTGDLQVTILTKRDNHTARALSVSYYMWGMPFFLKTAYNP